MKYREGYFYLFGKITDAIDRMEKNKIDEEKTILLEATCLWEEKAMSAGEEKTKLINLGKRK